jgi:hypothetical protein
MNTTKAILGIKHEKIDFLQKVVGKDFSLETLFVCVFVGKN